MNRELFVYIQLGPTGNDYVQELWGEEKRRPYGKHHYITIKKRMNEGRCGDYNYFVRNLVHLQKTYGCSPQPLTPFLMSFLPAWGSNFTPEQMEKLERDMAAHKTNAQR